MFLYISQFVLMVTDYKTTWHCLYSFEKIMAKDDKMLCREMNVEQTQGQ